MKLQKFSRGAFLAGLAALFLLLVGLSNQSLRHARLDLTENRIYTLSEGTRNILARIDEPLNLYLFFSDEAAGKLVAYRNYYQRVRETLEEYALYADGKIKLHFLDPTPFSEAEERAARLGVQAVPRQDGEKLYFGLAGTNTVGGLETLPFLQPAKEKLLEYELGKLIYSLSRLDKPVVGVMTSLDLYPGRIDQASGETNEPWIITDQLEQLFDMRLLAPEDLGAIDPDIKLLIVAHLKKPDDKTLYAIDQFVMRGGKAVFFVDPFADVEFLPVPANQPLEDSRAKSSNFNQLFRKWGFEVDENNVVGDAGYALKVATNLGTPITHIAMLGVRGADLNRADIVTEGLDLINFAMVSHIRSHGEAPAEFELTPLITSSDNAMPIDLNRFRFVPDPRTLAQNFAPTGKQYTIAARIKGLFPSAFDAPPEGAPDGERLTQSEETAYLAVVADSDLLADRMWARTVQFFGQRVVQPFASNRDFIVNLVDNMLGSEDLIGVRSRANFSRPFTRVLQIEQQANREFRDTEQRLQGELREAERRLQELQERRTDDSKNLLTAEQQETVRGFQQRYAEVQRQLREVRREQTKSIDALGSTLKAVNIGLVPALVALAALVIGVVRVRRRARRAAE